MKKVTLLTVVLFAGFTATAFAGNINTGQTATCNDAKSITIEVAKIANKANSSDFGYTTNDRGTGNVVVWKSANATTVPITLGPNDDNRSINDTDHGKTGIPVMGSMGRNKVVLTSQPAFSRGDSIGDISGKVTITNTGTNPVTVACN
ncbi:MAG TPA: hypothetical protein VKA69_05795 [Desulfobacteria bacterium]|nr:hypothetical protein [Desulfobacteria bacterium]